jgi:dihydrofolate reductase
MMAQFFDNAWWKDPEGGVRGPKGLLSGFGQHLTNNLVPFEKGEDGNLQARAGYSPFNLTNMGLLGMRSGMGYVKGPTATGGQTEYSGNFADYASNLSQSLQGQMMQQQKLKDSVLARELTQANISKLRRDAALPIKTTFKSGGKEHTRFYNPETGKTENFESPVWKPEDPSVLKSRLLDIVKKQADIMARLSPEEIKNSKIVENNLKELQLAEVKNNKIFMAGGENLAGRFFKRKDDFIEMMMRANASQKDIDKGTDFLEKMSFSEWLSGTAKGMDQRKIKKMIAAFAGLEYKAGSNDSTTTPPPVKIIPDPNKSKTVEEWIRENILGG